MNREKFPTNYFLMKHLTNQRLNHPQGILIQECRKMAQAVERDLSTLNKYGITEDMLHAFVKQINDYSTITNDETFLSNLLEKSKIKKDLRIELNDHVQFLMHHVALIYDKRSLDYKSFAARSYYKETESEMLRKCRLTTETMEVRMPELNKKNIQQSDADCLNDLADRYQNAILDESKEKLLRRVAREERLTQGLALKDKLQKLADTGKVAWERISHAKYVEYKLF